jgi:hypothetical protein
MEQRAKQPLLGNRIDTTSLPFSFNLLTIELHESVEVVPRIRDLWLHAANVSPHHIIKFFFLGIDVLFNAKDKIVRVKLAKVEIKVLAWRLGKKSDKDWLWNVEHEEKM